MLVIDGPPRTLESLAMNIHHLELFHYVAKHGGISRAVRAMPYGIQQPAVSGQILQLEQDLGTKLFERTPFRLTPPGAELAKFIAPFFDNIEPMATRLRKAAAPQLRLGASELALRDHLPAIIGHLRKHDPRVRLSLRSGFQPQIERWLLDKEIDLAITPIDHRPPAGIQHRLLLRVPLMLLVPRKSRWKKAADLWAGGVPEEPLICLPAQECMSRVFQRHLKQHKVAWTPAIEASSLELITRYVASGYGVGVNVALPGVIQHRGVRALPLEGCGPVDVAAMWRGKPEPLVQLVLEAAGGYIRSQWPDWACA